MAQYDPLGVKGGIPTNLGTDTVRADLVAADGFSTPSPPTVGDAVQVSGALTFTAASYLSTSPIIGIYRGDSGSVVRSGVVVPNYVAGLTLAAGDTVYLSPTAGKLTNIKPTKDVLHEVGVVVNATTGAILLQPKPVLSLPPSPPIATWFADYGPRLYEYLSPSGTHNGRVTSTSSNSTKSVCWDGEYIWFADNINPCYIEGYDPVSKVLVYGPYRYGYTDGSTYMTQVLAWDGSRFWIRSHVVGSQAVSFNRSGVAGPVASGLGNVLWIVYDGAGNLLIPNRYTNQVRKVRCSDGAVLATGTCTGAGAQAIGINGVVVNESGTRYYYQPYWTGNFPYPGWLSKFRISDMAEVAKWAMGINYPEGGAVNDGTYIYTLTGNRDYLAKNRLSDGGLESGWPKYIRVATALCYDGVWIWATAPTSTELRRIDPATGTYYLLTPPPTPPLSPAYTTYGCATTKSVLPWP